MEKWLKQAYLTFRLLSLDVVFGAFAGLLFTSRYLNADIGLVIGGIFALSVWIIYATDHLFDGITLKDNGIFKRHAFFYKYRIPVSTMIILAILGDIYLIVFHLPIPLQITGGILGFLVIVYMVLNHYISKHRRINFFKELFIALIYSLAIWSFPFVSGGLKYTFSMVPTFVLFFLIVLQNVLIYSYYEYDIDTILSKNTLPHFYGKAFTKTLFLAISCLVLGLCILMVAVYSKKAPFILAIYIIEVILSVIILLPNYFEKDERYGLLADGSFYLLSLCALL